MEFGENGAVITDKDTVQDTKAKAETKKVEKAPVAAQEEE